MLTNDGLNLSPYVVNRPERTVFAETMYGSPVQTTVRQRQVAAAHTFQIRQIGFLQIGLLIGVVTRRFS